MKCRSQIVLGHEEIWRRNQRQSDPMMMYADTSVSSNEAHLHDLGQQSIRWTRQEPDRTLTWPELDDPIVEHRGVGVVVEVAQQRREVGE